MSNEDKEPNYKSWNYASVVSMLLYLSFNSHPDIQFAVHHCARLSHSLKKIHAKAIKRICSYLYASVHTNKGNEPWLLCWRRFCWPVEPEAWSRSHLCQVLYRLCQSIGKFFVTGVSKLQIKIALSTLESEYIALLTAISDILSMRLIWIKLESNWYLILTGRHWSIQLSLQTTTELLEWPQHQSLSHAQSTI